MAKIDVNLNVKGSTKEVTGGGLGSLLGGNGAKGISGALGGLMGGLTKLLGPIALIGVLVKSSKGLQKMLGGIVKLIMLFLKPIGDLLYQFLKPIYLFFRPLARAFNAYFRLYRKEANTAMRAGFTFMKAGMPKKAADAFISSLFVSIKPFFNIGIKLLGTLAKSLIDVIFTPFKWLLKGMGFLLDTLGLHGAADYFYNLANGLDKTREATKKLIDEGIDALITATDNLLFNHIDKLSKAAGVIKTAMVASATLSDDDKKKIKDSFNVMDNQTLDDIIAKKRAVNKLAEKTSTVGDKAGTASGHLKDLAGSLDKIINIKAADKNLGPTSASFNFEPDMLQDVLDKLNISNVNSEDLLNPAKQLNSDVRDAILKVNTFYEKAAKLASKEALPSTNKSLDQFNKQILGTYNQTIKTNPTLSDTNKSIGDFTKNVKTLQTQTDKGIHLNVSVSVSGGDLESPSHYHFGSLSLPHMR